MKVFDRDVNTTIKRIPQVPLYLFYFAKCFWIFKRPIQVLSAYIRRKGIPGSLVELRDGLKIHLSEHPHDIVSVFVVFVREDYGSVIPGSIVVDIGANIGIFSLFAAHRKAARVHAYEPNTANFQCLCKNIESNHLEKVIVPKQFAVVGTPGEKVRFPTTPGAYNAILKEGSRVDFELVDTISLSKILDEVGSINLLKLDCEGAEYGILFSAGADVYSRISLIRMEYHSRKVDEIQEHLAKYGFFQCSHKVDTECSGNLWFKKTD